MTTFVRFIDANTIQPVPQTYTWPDGTTTSNFHLSPPDVLARAGFLPLIEGARPTPDATTFVGPPTYTTDGTTVTSTYPLAPKPTEQINAAALDAKIDTLLDTLVSWQTKAGAADTTLKTLTDQARTKKTTATATTAEIRTLYAGIETAGNQLRDLVAANTETTRAVVAALRLVAGRTDDITGT